MRHFQPDFLLGQVERAHGFLPSHPPSRQIPLGQFQELAGRVNAPQVSSL